MKDNIVSFIGGSTLTTIVSALTMKGIISALVLGVIGGAAGYIGKLCVVYCLRKLNKKHDTGGSDKQTEQTTGSNT